MTFGADLCKCLSSWNYLARAVEDFSWGLSGARRETTTPLRRLRGETLRRYREIDTSVGESPEAPGRRVKFAAAGADDIDRYNGFGVL